MPTEMKTQEAAPRRLTLPMMETAAAAATTTADA